MAYVYHFLNPMKRAETAEDVLAILHGFDHQITL